MAEASKQAERARANDPRLRFDEDGSLMGFAVTVEEVVGVVEFDDGLALAPHEAAFAMIASKAKDGTYRFPTEGGGLCEVVVTWGGA